MVSLPAGRQACRTTNGPLGFISTLLGPLPASLTGVTPSIFAPPRAGENPDRLYAKAVEYMRRCLELNPDEHMRNDIAKLFDGH